ncbi:MAG: transcription-repair coupling factor [Clostridia bacterium]|nr:transcription-repair coupling factor [Clostridia bacterium]
MSLRIRALLEMREAREFLDLLPREAASAHPLPAAVSGLPEEALTLLALEGCRRLQANGRPCLILVRDVLTATRVAERLSGLGLRAAAYQPREYILYHITASHEAERARLSVLAGLMNGELDAVVTTPEAALGYTVPRARLAERVLTLHPGDTLSPEALCRVLSACGFLSVTTVEGAGQFAHRGGIVDFSADGAAPPVRVEFFGDEIDRLGSFDPLSQRLLEPLPSAAVFPAREVIPDKEGYARIRDEVRRMIAKAEAAEVKSALTAELTAVDAGVELPFADKYIKQCYPEEETLLSYFPPEGTPLFLLGASELLTAMPEALRLYSEQEGARVTEGALPARYASHATAATLTLFCERAFALYLNVFSAPPPGLRLSGLFGFSCRLTPQYGEKPALLHEDLADYRNRGYRVVLLCRTRKEAEERAGDLSALGYRTRLAEEGCALPAAGEILLTGEECGAGFELPNLHLTLLSLCDDPAKGAAKARRRARYVGKKSGVGDRILSYAELHEGDYVVHAAHGIGRFLGMQTLTVDGTVSDYITLQYAGEEKLFLRADKLELVSRYIGAGSDSGTVRLSKIGGTAWGTAKARAKAAAKDMAKELVALYAARSRLPGYAYPPEGEIEAEFAASFEYEETPAQTQAIAEIAADMSRPVPMDRLLCGDVGYGKTEVALRAAFRAAMAGKQVAILVPTTILALQHYNTIRSRMRGYPLNVEMISRFRKPREVAAILRRLARGEIDIIVGTHALLSKNVAFRDLGLLIVDEEQRFGVGQKEKIKQMTSGVDVLTLTATPIPRTLNMAMNGIRDMSVLDEAPEDRSPVATFVMEHDDLMIAEAMRRELSRGGQVLYLYNRVETIFRVAAKVQEALPEARLAVAHGQMDREELEGIWQALVLGELDILVATTIIETGVDLPNANTLIIEDADRLGLAQLHQIRGRVGRSARRAYAYCTYRPGKALSEVATKRLEAIREYAEFGAGFRVALRDLEIRGAGNLLGAEQHGHIEAVGYDLYVRLLSEAVLEEKGESVKPPVSATVDLGLDAYIPEAYIPSSAHRIDMYKKLSLIGTDDDLGDVLDEFCDRFGEPPQPVLSLLHIALARAMATGAGFQRIERRGSDLRFLFPALSLAAWSEAFATLPGLRMTGSPEPFVTYRLRPGEDPAETALTVLRAYLVGSGAGKTTQESQ